MSSFTERLYRYRHLWALCSFALGLGSYFMVDRQPWLAALMAAGLLLTWLLVITQNSWRGLLRHTPVGAASQGGLTLLLQAVHQEAFFFSLPFVLLQWSAGAQYFLFTGLLLATALVSIVDPLYFRLVKRRPLFFVFHAWALFVGLLVVLPLLFHWDTETALLAAGLVTALAAVPSFWRLGPNRGPARWLMLLLISLVIAIAPRWLAVMVPPLTLSLEQRTMALSINRQQRQPLVVSQRFKAADLDNGVYAFTAIKAPLGLGQEVYHHWFHNREQVDRIALRLHGGREAGYRTWSHKQQFPDNPRGQWRVEVRTAAGQIIGVLRFRVD